MTSKQTRMKWLWLAASLANFGVGACLTACDFTPEQRPTLSREQLMDPDTCQTCHPNAYKEWASSMHAYASDDPVFIAMNKRGQREAKLGKFCINCHAPMAVREGFTKDGLNMKDAPKSLRGVTCYFCHNAQEVTDTHNNPIKLANDTTMRAALHNPKNPGVHGVQYSQLHDGKQLESAKLCGSCHDIVTPNGVHLERTYAEWQHSVFSHAPRGQTCNQCHMQHMDGVAADDPDAHVPSRTLHMHLFPGVDTALSKFPNTVAQRKAVDCDLTLAVLVYELCVPPQNVSPVQFRDFPIKVTLETNAGHRFPSGAAHDRRLWLELSAYDDADKLVYQSGHIADGETVVDRRKSTTSNHDPLVLNDRMYDKDGKEALMFWDAVPHMPDAASIMCDTLPETLNNQPGSHSCAVSYVLPPTLSAAPKRVRIELHEQAIAREVLESLVASGDLAADVIDRMPTLTLADSVVEWKFDPANPDETCVNYAVPNTLDCPTDYQCELYPDLPQCAAK